MHKFVQIGHTADIGLNVYGKNLEELFENSSLGMFSLLTDIKKISANRKVNVKVNAPDIETLLVSWLNELIYLIGSKKMLFNKFRINRIYKNNNLFNLEGIVFGEKINLAKHHFYLEVKSTTYHNLEIKKNSKGQYYTTIIFDV